MVRFREVLRGRLRAFAHDRPFGLQLYGALWHHLSAGLEPGAPSRIEGVYPRPGMSVRPAGPEDAALISRAVSMAPPLPRLVYLFWLVTDLDAPRLAEMTGLSETQVRAVRAGVSALIQEALQQ